ncbi:MAG: DDE-type integrase/transposase/recombinase [Sedimentisphaerales bacterium]|nr:DDE-type integrase/transposase/recombinase [Sedimentisphaerales bacterium]
MECRPGQEAQIDFGAGAPVVRSDGKRKRPHVFRMVLSFSRKGYSEAVYHQNTDTFIRCLENAFWHFGGVPRTLLIDKGGTPQDVEREALRILNKVKEYGKTRFVPSSGCRLAPETPAENIQVLIETTRRSEMRTPIKEL